MRIGEVWVDLATGHEYRACLVLEDRLLLVDLATHAVFVNTIPFVKTNDQWEEFFEENGWLPRPAE